MTKAEKNRLKLYDLEIKYEQLLDQVKKDSDSKKDDKPKAIKEKKLSCDILPADDTSDSPDYPQIENAWKECLICNKKFKSEITSQNHDKKLHMTPGPGKDRSYKCIYCSSNNLKRQELYDHILNSHKK